jgi:steroid delta-isomerase-like uncharacterized protein
MAAQPDHIAAELVAAWNAHDLDRLEALYAATYEGMDVGDMTPARGPAGARRAVERYLQAFPDLHLTVERSVTDSGQVALFWTARGTHRGPLLHIPPTGRFVAVRGSSLLTVQDSRITSGLHIWDVAGLLRSLGLLPEL